MPSLTVDLDPDTLALLDQSAKASGLSQSRLVAEWIKAQAWQQDMQTLAGRFPDFPLSEDALQTGQSKP
jgi:predicted transcriptional regulator